MRLVVLRGLVSGGALARLAAAILISLSVLSGNAGIAVAQDSNLSRNGNNVTLTCNGNFSPLQTLCADGNHCNNLNLSNPPTSSASPQDNVSFSPANTPVNVTWEIINPDTTADPPPGGNPGNNDNPVAYSIGGVGSFSLSEGGTDVKTQTASAPPPVSISVTHVGGNQQFAVIRYRVKCTAQAPSIKIVKTTDTGDGTFDFALSGSTALNKQITTNGQTGNTGFFDVNPGSLVIQETSFGPGYHLDTISCTGGNPQYDVANHKVTLAVANGDQTTCTFNNKKDKASLKIVKKTDVGDGIFDFALSGSTSLNKQIQTTNQSGNTGFFDVNTGSLVITETSFGPGYHLDTISCTGGNPQYDVANKKVTLTIASGDQNTCTFNNKKDKGSLKIVKKTDVGDGTFDFALSGSTSLNKQIQTTNQSGNTGFFDVNTGSLVITETSFGPGYHLDTISCTGGNPQYDVANKKVTLTIASGDQNTCTFNNKKDKGSLKIVKKTDVGDGTFDFALSGSTSLNKQIQTTNQSGNTGFFDVNTGSLVITETSFGPGYHLDTISCTGGNPQYDVANKKVTLTIASGDQNTCTFNNKKDKGNLKIVKNTIGGDGTFTFTGSLIGADAAFGSITTNGGTGFVQKTLAAGSYTITESNPTGSGFNFTNLQCTGDNNGSVNTGTRTATINLDAGENVVCTYTNTKQSSVKIVKNTTGGDGTFTFTGSLIGADAAFGSITTNGGTGFVQKTLAAGSYTITEGITAGFDFAHLQCSGDNNGSVNTGTRTATINLDAGENVVCTYSNTRQKGAIVVKKVTIGGDGTFDFAINAPASPTSFSLMNGGQQPFNNLVIGQYTITETNLPTGWSLQSISCGQKQGNSVTVNLAANQTVTCIFTNFKEKDDRMEEVTKAFIYRRVDNLLTHGPDRGRLLRRLEGQQPEQGLKDTGPIKFSSELAGFQSQGAPFDSDRFRFGSGLGQLNVGESDNGKLDVHQSGWDVHQNSDTGRLSAFSALGMSTNFATDFKFAASLSDLQAKAQAAEDQKAQRKLQDAGLGFYDQPYSRPRNALRPGLDIWAEGHLSFYEDGTGGLTRDGRFGVIYLGADVPLSTKVLFGALVQFDWTEEKINDPATSGRIEGNGWLAGPYIGIKLAPSLLFDARVAWGTSQNDITLTDALAGTRTGSFDTTRWLATATLTGNYQYGPWRLSPQAGLAYGNEKHDAFTNSLGQVVSGSDISIGRFTLGSEVGYNIALRDGTLVEPHIGLTGIWNFHSDDLVINGVLVTPNSTRAKVEGGVILRSPSGPSVRAAVSYDGIGDSDLSAVTGKFWVNIPFK